LPPVFREYQPSLQTLQASSAEFGHSAHHATWAWNGDERSTQLFLLCSSLGLDVISEVDTCCNCRVSTNEVVITFPVIHVDMYRYTNTSIPLTFGVFKMTTTTTTATEKLNATTEALREAFETNGTEWNEDGKTLVNFQKAERIAEMDERIQYMGAISDGFKNYDFSIAKAAPLIAEIASKRMPCDFFYGDDSEEDVTAVKEVSLALYDFVACFDKSDEEIAVEISNFIKKNDGDIDLTGGHTIADAWERGTKPDEIDLEQVESKLDLALDCWSDADWGGNDSVRKPALMYLNALHSKPAIKEILATEWLEIIRAQCTTEEDA
jgi:hypothetical protein